MYSGRTSSSLADLVQFHLEWISFFFFFFLNPNPRWDCLEHQPDAAAAIKLQEIRPAIQFDNSTIIDKAMKIELKPQLNKLLELSRLLNQPI